MNYTTFLVALHEIEARALAAASNGDTRISIRLIAEQVRADMKVQINNNELTSIVDNLCSKYPHLSPLVERRSRRPRGRNKDTSYDAGVNAAVARVLQLAPNRGLTLAGLVFTTKEGATLTASMSAVRKIAGLAS